MRRRLARNARFSAFVGWAIASSACNGGGHPTGSEMRAGGMGGTGSGARAGIQGSAGRAGAPGSGGGHATGGVGGTIGTQAGTTDAGMARVSGDSGGPAANGGAGSGGGGKPAPDGGGVADGGNGPALDSGAGADEGCIEGTQRCVSGQLDQLQTCGHGHWIVTSCPDFNVCVDDACTPVCDGLLADATIPSVCVFPLTEGTDSELYLWTNDTQRLPIGTSGTVAGLVSDGHTNTPILTGSGTTWPFYWRLTYPNDVAVVMFQLGPFEPLIQKVTIQCKVRTAGLSSAVTTELFVASNGHIFATGTLPAPASWRVDDFFVAAPATQSFNYDSSPDFLEVAVTGDGLGDTPDALDLNWYFLQIAN